MDAAKNAINKLTSNHGKHTTDVTEHYKPAVTHEEVAPTREHQATTVIDSEVHQDHHHTSVLPVKHQEVLPTKHSHQMAETKHSEHRHGDHEAVRSKVDAELGAFKDKTQTRQTEETHSAAPVVAGEHHHHHVHETIQPVIQKQTIAPEVVHTTVPVHEVHHSEPKHYTASALPAVTLDEFKKQGGSLTGIADRTERFEGEPEKIAKQGHLHGFHDKHSGLNSSANGVNGTNGVQSSTTGVNGTSGHGIGSGTSSTGELSRAQQAIDSRVDRSTGLDGNAKHNMHNTTSNTSGTSTASKPSLMDKLNPFKDADGDGKKGVMN